MWKILDLSNKQAHIFLFFSGKVIAQYTVWKFQDFCITQILREINFEDSWSAKSAISIHLEALNFDFYEFLHFFMAEIYQMNKIHSP